MRRLLPGIAEAMTKPGEIMGHIFLTLVLACTLTSCGAEDKTTASSPSPTMLDKLTSLGRHAGQKAVEFIDSAKPRKVARGALPEITITGGEIRINGNAVGLGQPMADWKKVLPGIPRCEVPKAKEINSCMWDELGIYLLEYRSTVFEFNIFFYLSPWNDSESQRADGSIRPAKPDWRPKQPYTGYFEMDGYGIDEKTTFSEVSKNVDPKRGLRCGRFDDCSLRRGRHFDAKGRLSLSMTRSDSEGQLEEFSVYAGETDYLPPTPPDECTPDSIEARMEHCVPPKPNATRDPPSEAKR